MSVEENRTTHPDCCMCPHLGLREDKETAISYPAEMNCCYHARPVAYVSFDHQRRYCLTEHYSECSVLKQKKLVSLPKKYRGAGPESPKPSVGLPLLAFTIVMLAGLIVSILLGVIRLPGYEGMALFPTSNPIPTIFYPTRTPLPPTATRTPTMVLPTRTRMVFTPTEIAPHFLDTPIGSVPQLIIHRALPGESFEQLATQYKTSIAAIKAVNFNLPDRLFENYALVIPLNTTRVTGLPKFSTHEVIVDGISIEEQAQLLQVDSRTLREFNQLPAGYILTIGEWLLIPNK